MNYLLTIHSSAPMSLDRLIGKGGGEEEPKRDEGEKGPLSDLIKGCDLNRYLIKWLLPHNAGNSPCSQNHD